MLRLVLINSVLFLVFVCVLTFKFLDLILER